MQSPRFQLGFKKRFVRCHLLSENSRMDSITIFIQNLQDYQELMEVLKRHDWGVLLKWYSATDEGDKGNVESGLPCPAKTKTHTLDKLCTFFYRATETTLKALSQPWMSRRSNSAPRNGQDASWFLRWFNNQIVLSGTLATFAGSGGKRQGHPRLAAY